jgi:hypothetical protein
VPRNSLFWVVAALQIYYALFMPLSNILCRANAKEKTRQWRASRVEL